MNIGATPQLGATRQALCLSAIVVAALTFGALISVRPMVAAGLVLFTAILAFAFLAPAAHLTLLIFATAILPYDLQNAYSVLGGSGVGLVLSDTLLLTGLLRAFLVTVRTPLTHQSLAIGGATVVLLLIAGAQALHGYRSGAPLSLAGYELRALLGWSALLIALPIFADPVERRRLLKGLVVVGIGLGLWGLVQYFVRIPQIGGASYGVFEGVNYTEGAVSIQGGLFAFPIAFVMGLAALSSKAQLSSRARSSLVILVALNGMSLLLTYERTFWVAAALGFGFLVMKSRSSQRVKAVLILAGAMLVVLPMLAAVAPGAVTGAQQRLLSIGQYGSDDSVRVRIVETRAAVRKVEAAPLLGSGLGDEITYGMPWLGVRPQSTDYLHNGYVWVAWKMGIPATLLLLAIVGWAIVSRAPPNLDALGVRVRHGAQAGLFLTLVVSLMFPAFRALAITTTLGVLVALCVGRPGSVAGRISIHPSIGRS